MQYQKEQDIDFMRRTAEKLFAAVILEDYGNTGLDYLSSITTLLSNLYRYINLTSNYDITIYRTVNSENSLDKLFSSGTQKLSDLSFFASNTCSKFTVEIVNNDEFIVILEEKVDISLIISDSVVYSFNRGCETIHGKQNNVQLDTPPDAISYFSFPTFKSLDGAFERYRTLKSLRSNCPYLKSAWFDDKRIFFSPRPEHLLRTSLYDFLATYLRAEVREEQNVNTSEPVDIKVTWNFSSHIALIEVKWLGKSLSSIGQADFNQKYYPGRANEGALQLANYLEENKIYTSQNLTVGYLVVFDARRNGTSTNTTDINQADGFFYQNKDIVYNPDYHASRTDFAKPVRFFMEPRVTL